MVLKHFFHVCTPKPWGNDSTNLTCTYFLQMGGKKATNQMKLFFSAKMTLKDYRWLFQIFHMFNPNLGEDEPILTSIFFQLSNEYRGLYYPVI